jgi:hypothetical protein
MVSVYHTKRNRDQQNHIASRNHVTAYSWKQYIEINLKLVACLLKFHWKLASGLGGSIHSSWKCIMQPRLQCELSYQAILLPTNEQYLIMLCNSFMTELDDDEDDHHVDGVRLCLRTVATNRPTVHPPGDV